MYNNGWKNARMRAAVAYEEQFGRSAHWGFANLRVHDLRHTLGHRARSADVSFEDRQDILGHASGRMTTHYSAAEIGRLVEALNRVADQGERSKHETVTLLRVVE